MFKVRVRFRVRVRVYCCYDVSVIYVHVKQYQLQSVNANFHPPEKKHNTFRSWFLINLKLSNIKIKLNIIRTVYAITVLAY